MRNDDGSFRVLLPFGEFSMLMFISFSVGAAQSEYSMSQINIRTNKLKLSTTTY